MAAPPIPADPRPSVSGDVIVGSTCTACDHRSTRRDARCERCLGDTFETSFGPGGTVWSASTVHIRVGDRKPPFVLAYVDLDDGPRVLAHLDGDEPSVGDRVRVTGSTDGDIVAAVAR